MDACYNQGSTGEIAYHITRAVIDDGGKAELLYALGERKEQYGRRFTVVPEIYIHALLSRLMGWFCKYAPISTQRLVKEIRHFHPDIIHIHDPKPYYFNLKKVLKVISDIECKVVITLHSEFFYTGKCGHALDCIQFNGACSNCPQLRTYPKTLFFDHTKKMHEGKIVGFGRIKDLYVVCPSRWLADRTRTSHFRNRRISVIHNGVDTDVFRRYNSNVCPSYHTKSS